MRESVFSGMTTAFGRSVILSVLVIAGTGLHNHGTAAGQSPEGLPACTHGQNKCTQDWTGIRTTTAGASQSLVLHVKRVASGEIATVDLPDFGAVGIPAAQFAMKAGRIHFELIGDTSNAVFDGSVRGSALEGTWQEGDHRGRFDFSPSSVAAQVFREENVSFANGEVKLAGTLLLPAASAPTAAIVFVQGAGAEQRYASRFLAEFFAKRGVATLIYDKRGAGQSSGDWKRSSFEDLAGDATAAVRLLSSRSEIDPRRIGLMGSSQGGWIVPMVALRLPDLAFLIVKSAAAVTPERQELARVESQMLAEGDRAADIAEALALYQRAIAYARTGEGWQTLSAEINADSQKKWAFFDRDTPRDYWFFTQIRLSFDHDPLPVLAKAKTPLLVIYGGEDDDGPPLQSQIGALAEAMRAGGKVSKLEIFPNADHTMRTVTEKGQAWEFPRYAPGYLASLATWVELQTSRDDEAGGQR